MGTRAELGQESYPLGKLLFPNQGGGIEQLSLFRAFGGDLSFARFDIGEKLFVVVDLRTDIKLMFLTNGPYFLSVITSLLFYVRRLVVLYVIVYV